jgi:hypothetical protein
MAGGGTPKTPKIEAISGKNREIGLRVGDGWGLSLTRAYTDLSLLYLCCAMVYGVKTPISAPTLESKSLSCRPRGGGGSHLATLRLDEFHSASFWAAVPDSWRFVPDFGQRSPNSRILRWHGIRLRKGKEENQ